MREYVVKKIPITIHNGRRDVRVPQIASPRISSNSCHETHVIFVRGHASRLTWQSAHSFHVLGTQNFDNWQTDPRFGPAVQKRCKNVIVDVTPFPTGLTLLSSNHHHHHQLFSLPLVASMSVFVAGASANVFYSFDTRPSRVSLAFAKTAKCTCSTPYGPAVPLSVTVQTPGGTFTGIIDFVVEPLCEVDVLLGSDWVDMCASRHVSAGLESLPVYRCSVLCVCLNPPFLRLNYCFRSRTSPSAIMLGVSVRLVVVFQVDCKTVTHLHT